MGFSGEKCDVDADLVINSLVIGKDPFFLMLTM